MSDKDLGLLCLPAKLRNRIYDLVFSDKAHVIYIGCAADDSKNEATLCTVNRQLRAKTLSMFYAQLVVYFDAHDFTEGSLLGRLVELARWPEGVREKKDLTVMLQAIKFRDSWKAPSAKVLVECTEVLKDIRLLVTDITPFCKIWRNPQ